MGASPRSSAFTLIELLVTLGIIGALSLLIVPVAFKVRDNARAAACANNLKQAGVGFGLYAADNDGRLPTHDIGVDGNISSSFWSQVAPYVNWQQGSDRASLAAHTIMHCPNHTEAPGSFSYRGNSELLRAPETGGLKVAQVNNPSKKILLYEVHVYCEWPIASISASGTGKTPWMPEFAHPAHGTFSNFLFADGHVEATDENLSYRPTYWEP